jgi:hypothetical protein
MYVRFVDQVEVCHLCQVKFKKWQQFLKQHVRRKGNVSQFSLEQAHTLYMVFVAHVSKCRVIAKSLGESLLYEQYDRDNNRELVNS